MQGVIPDATETAAGAVKIRKTESESGTATVPTVGDVDTALVQKVDKVTGKGLSSNDYDNAAKAKVDAIPAILSTRTRRTMMRRRPHQA